MADQLPTITGKRAVNAGVTPSTSLLGRGLAAIQSQQLAAVEQDKRYRQARDIYNRITNYGWESRFNSEALPKQAEQLDLFEANLLQPFFTMLRQLPNVFTVFQQLADQGYGKAYFPLFRMYCGGQGISENIEKVNYYSRMTFDWCFANQGLNDPEIWCDLGWMYESVHGVEQDDELAVFWYRKAAEQGYINAQNNLARWYERYNRNRIKYDEDEDEIGFETSLNEQINEQIVFWYKQAADQEDASAQCNLGWIYESGRGVEQDDEQATFWYRKAAEQGNAEAQCQLGFMYQCGYGVDEDDEEAVFWYRKAAEQGEAYAQFNLGFMYQGGHGVDEDDEEAVFWYRKAAEQGNETAQEYLTKLGINWKDA